ncbi:MAG: FHA domain-containing protein [Armatimonadetes bacterium]|jgi:hypothetical protein|nr:FHA domain-containing protein [Armatimonadota bacterium]
MWRLVGIQGVYNGRFFDLDKDSIAIGTGDGCGVSLSEDQAIADNQAEILLCNGNYVFKDLGGACPTTINGTVPTGMVTLNHGDMVQIGESVFRVEQTEVPGRATACAFPRTETTKGIELSASMLKAVPLKLLIAVGLAILLIAAIAVPNIRRANECRAKRTESIHMAQEVIASLQSIGSALKVGVSHDEYGRKIIDAQTKIDVYIAKFGKDEFDGLGGKLLKAQQAYVDAGELWNYKIRFERSDYFDHGDPYFRSLPGERERIRAASELLDLVSRYPQIDKKAENGGAEVDSTYETGGTYRSYHTDTTMQIIWECASEEVSKLKP